MPRGRHRGGSGAEAASPPPPITSGRGAQINAQKLLRAPALFRAAVDWRAVTPKRGARHRPQRTGRATHAQGRLCGHGRSGTILFKALRMDGSAGLTSGEHTCAGERPSRRARVPTDGLEATRRESVDGRRRRRDTALRPRDPRKQDACGDRMWRVLGERSRRRTPRRVLWRIGVMLDPRSGNAPATTHRHEAEAPGAATDGVLEGRSLAFLGWRRVAGTRREMDRTSCASVMTRRRWGCTLRDSRQLAAVVCCGDPRLVAAIGDVTAQRGATSRT